MRHCNTLPLSSNLETMKKFFDATNTLLKEGNFVLVYPEQSMWWNYRKPKPLKRGAYVFACKADVPVLPCFITMKDSEELDETGFPIQEYTIHIPEPISTLTTASTTVTGSRTSSSATQTSGAPSTSASTRPSSAT